ncbi:MAG: hypothetical protein ACJAZM_002018 [Cyclobacteriaceae bacterium]|jgi:hypothetical protein
MKSMRTPSNLILAISLAFLISCNSDSESPENPLENYQSTYDLIQGEIWDRSCTSCHQSGTSFANQSELVLTVDASYDQLMNRVPQNAAAKADGLVLLGDKGLESVYQSFLWEKINAQDLEHYYADHPEYGSIMPLGGDFLTNGELELIREWIVAGAPRNGIVADVKLLENTDVYEPTAFEVLAPPTQGYQFHVGPFEVGPNEDRELFTYKKLNNESDIFIEEVQITMRPGSHHFILYNFPEDYPTSILPKEDIIRDVYYSNGAYNEITLFYMQYHQFVTGTQWPWMRYKFPEGVALRIPANTGFDLNSHYANGSDETIQGEVYANIHTINEEDVVHVAEILQLNNQNFVLPAGQITTLQKTYTFDTDINVFQLYSHAHQHMTEFKVYINGGDRNGELIYVAYDWEHPPILQMDPPLALKSGEGFRLEATYDNDEDRDLRFGLRSTDEMMILFGAYYE